MSGEPSAEKGLLRRFIAWCRKPTFTPVCTGAGCPVCGEILAVDSSVTPPLGGRTLAEIAADSERMADEADARHRDLPPEVTGPEE